MEEKKRAPSIKCFSSLLKYMAFFIMITLISFCQSKWGFLLFSPRLWSNLSVNTYYYYYCARPAKPTSKRKDSWKKIHFTEKKIILFSTQTTFELCRKPILYISPLPFPFILLIEQQQQKAPNFIIPTHFLFFHMSKNAYRIPSDEKRIEWRI